MTDARRFVDRDVWQAVSDQLQTERQAWLQGAAVTFTTAGLALAGAAVTFALWCRHHCRR